MPNEPREPVPLLGPEWTAAHFDERVIVKQTEHPGWVELVQLRDGVTRAALRLPKETP